MLKDIVYSNNSPECKLDLYLPESDKIEATYIFFHGGGLEAGDKKDFLKIAEFLLKYNIAVVSANYRMYQNAKFPDYLVDCAAAVKWTLDNAQKYNLKNFCIGGTSAGGYITMMLFFNKEYLLNSGVDLSLIKGYLFDAGQPTCHFNYLKYEKNIDPRAVLIDETAPIYYLREDYKPEENLPEILITCSDNDIINRQNQLTMLHTAMLQFNYPEERLTFKIYENEVSHCTYCNKKYYMEDILAFIIRATK